MLDLTLGEEPPEGTRKHVVHIGKLKNQLFLVSLGADCIETIHTAGVNLEFCIVHEHTKEEIEKKGGICQIVDKE